MISRHLRLGRREDGQTTIFAAPIILFVLLPIMGAAVEGGNMYAQYRQMQSAADLAALTGAQDLNGTLAGSNSAIADACSFVQQNGFSDCSTGLTVACAPPQTQSPYGAFVSYGSSSSCTPGPSSYIEVKVSKTFGTIPIFNIPVTLATHAVARNGIPDIRDYAIVALDPTALSSGSPAIKFNNNKPCNDTTKAYCVEALVAEGAVSSNPITNGISTGNSTPPYQVDCNAGWFDNANDSTPAQVASLRNGTLSVAPAACLQSDSNFSAPTFDSPVAFQANAGQIADPYGSSCPPIKSATTAPTSAQTGGIDCGSNGTSNMSTNCPECSKVIGAYYDRKNSVWTSISGNITVNNSSSVIELWPGIYPNNISLQNGTIYLNPGVYTFQGLVKITGGNVCVYGAPVCHVFANGNIIPTYTFPCNAASFSGSGNTIDKGTWYYNCSPYGVWDSSCHGNCATRSNANIQTAAPTFLNPLDLSASNILLNGVTIFMQCDTGCSANGNQIAASGGPNVALAAPNPYIGTGAASDCTSSVDYPNGTASCNRTIPEVSADFGGGSVPSPVAGEYMYPNVDFRFSGEPAAPVNAVVWKGELGPLTYQHLHFLVFSQNQWDSVGFTGSGSYNLYGIIHAFPAYASFPNPPAVLEACPNCTVSVGGNSGGGGGPPMLMGQIISDSSQYSGNSIVEVFNRPGGQPSGPGTSLVQ